MNKLVEVTLEEVVKVKVPIGGGLHREFNAMVKAIEPERICIRLDDNPLWVDRLFVSKLPEEEQKRLDALRENLAKIKSGLYGYDRSMNLVLLSENPKAVPAKPNF